MTSITTPVERSAARPSVEAARRRTFAIISHPDAGKTTLTEKFLLYAGAVQEAGAVRARSFLVFPLITISTSGLAVRFPYH